MHIAFLTPEYPHELCSSYGGIGTSIKNLAEGLIRKNIKVTVFVYGQREDQKFSEDHIEFHFIKQRKYSWLGWYRYRKYLEAYLNQVIEKAGIDVLEAPEWTGITAFMKFKCPLVLRLHGSDTYFCKLEGRRQKLKNFWFEKLALHNADHILSVSAFTALKTSEYFKIKRDIRVIPNFIDTGIFSSTNTKTKQQSILYFGSIIRKKGVLELAEIFNQVIEANPNTSLVLAGRDIIDIQTRKSTLELFKSRLSREAENQFKYLGVLDYKEVRTEIEKARVLVFPSFAEALPMTWLEAMAMAKPLVSSDIGWAKEIVLEGETGYMIHPTQHEKFADRINEILKNEQLFKRMGEAARKRIEHKFSDQVVIQQNISFYKKLILQLS